MTDQNQSQQNQPQGTTSSTNPSWNQTVGSAKESVGNLVGSENLRQAGIQQNEQGKAEEAKGQLQDWGQGVTDRAQGAVGSVGAALKGDRATEDRFRDVHDAGKTAQKNAEESMERRA